MKTFEHQRDFINHRFLKLKVAIDLTKEKATDVLEVLTCWVGQSARGNLVIVIFLDQIRNKHPLLCVHECRVIDWPWVYDCVAAVTMYARLPSAFLSLRCPGMGVP